MSSNPDCVLNGEIIKLAECRLDIYELGFHRAYAVFDFCRSINGKIRFLEDHLERFDRSIRLSGIHNPYSTEDIKQLLLSLNESNAIKNGAFKLILSAGSSNDGATVDDFSTNLVILNSPFIPLPEIYFSEGVALISKQYRRENPLIKSTNYFFALQHRHEMLAKGAIDILYYEDHFSETSRANIFFVRNDKIYTPARDMLPGITRKNLMKQQPQITEADIPVDFIHDCDEVIISSSSKELLPVIRIDDTIIGRGKAGPVYHELLDEFRRIEG